jgi:DNA replication protein DnaC
VQSEITPEQAQRRLEERRKVVKVEKAKPAKTAGAEADKIVMNVRRVPDSEADRRKRESDAIERRTWIAHLLDSSGAPVRHLENARLVSRTGRFARWAETERKVVAGDGHRLGGIGSGFTLALVGPRGNGKTQVALSAVLSAAEAGLRPLYRTAEGFFMDLKGSYADGSKRSERDVVADYRRPKLLVLDELDATSQKEWEHRPLFELLNWRYNDRTDTILVCNWTKAEFEQAAGPKLCSRMKETGGIIECEWPSFR